MKNSNKDSILKWATVIASGVLFCLSLTQNAYCIQSNLTTRCVDSASALLLGWFGVLLGGAAVTWLANPFLVVSWVIIFTAPGKFALGTSLFTSLIMLSFLTFDKVLINEAGHYSAIIDYSSGYWLWLSSSVILVLGNLLVMVSAKNRTEPYSA